ncbi:MAG: hypothetical protein V7646_2364 [Pseudonocardia sp.]|jgi:hypothetical protein
MAGRDEDTRASSRLAPNPFLVRHFAGGIAMNQPSK